jgi:hypothetical protein
MNKIHVPVGIAPDPNTTKFSVICTDGSHWYWDGSKFNERPPIPGSSRDIDNNSLIKDRIKEISTHTTEKLCKSDEKHITDWPCRACGVKDLIRTDVGDGTFEDYRFTCNSCGHRWIEEGIDS